MKKNFKKSLSLILAVLMAVSCFSVVGFAADAAIDITTSHSGANHKWRVEDNVDASGCTDGKIGAIYCTSCNNVLIKSAITVSAPHNLEGVDWSINGTVTNCEAGYTRTKTCKDCKNVVVTETYNLHTWKVTGTDKAAKCTDISYENKECTVCKKTVKEPLEPGKHSWGDDAEAGWVVSEKATCTLDGTRKRECSKCIEVETEVIKATGHKYKVVDAGREPSCEQEGSTAKRACIYCNDTIEGISLGKLSHKDEDGDGYCDNCEGYQAADGSICECPCHQKSGILSKLYKIVLFIFRLFKIGQKCGCGADHYIVD